MATGPTPNDLTRQQLDELDALLQRMLSLPLNKAETVKVPPAPPLPLPEMPAPSSRGSVNLWRSDSAPAPKMSPYIAAEPEPAIAFTPSFTSVESTARTYSAPMHSSDGSGTLRGVDAPALPFGYANSYGAHDEESAASAGVFGRLDLTDVNPFAESPSHSMLPPPPASSSGVPFFAWPVVACNWMLEAALAWMGPLGAVVRLPAVKHLLGFAGFVLLVGAGVWCAKGMGWVNLRM